MGKKKRKGKKFNFSILMYQTKLSMESYKRELREKRIKTRIERKRINAENIKEKKLSVGEKERF